MDIVDALLAIKAGVGLSTFQMHQGHTSGMGDKDANLKLSQARADNAKSHLMYKFGIDGNRILAKGYGLTRPVASNKTTSGRIQNRRIVAVFSCE